MWPGQAGPARFPRPRPARGSHAAAKRQRFCRFLRLTGRGFPPNRTDPKAGRPASHFMRHRALANQDRGTKREDPDTGKKFYDLNRDPIISPYTGKSYPRSYFEQAVVGRKAGNEEPEDEEELETEETATESGEGPEVISLEDADAEESGGDDGEDIPDVEDVEDVEDLGDDDDDVFLEEDEEEEGDLDFDVGGGSDER